MMNRFFFFSLLCCLTTFEMLPTKLFAQAQQQSAVRGAWLTNVVSDAMYSQEKLASAVKYAHELGLNALFVVVWNRGYTLYPSPLMKQTIGVEIDPKFAGRDPLREVIDEAKKYGIKVFAWYEFGFSSSYEESDGGALIRKHPNWAAIGANGKIVSKNKFQWMNAFLPEVQDFMIALVKESVVRYPDLDGIQGDDRLPAVPSEAGYDEYTVKKYKETHFNEAPPKYSKDHEWVEFRAGLLNDFMRRMSDTLRSVRKNIIISMAPSLYPWSKQEYLQDWPTWLKNGWVDLVCPQVYRYQFDRYKKELEIITKEQVAEQDRFRIAPGILSRVGDYYASPEFLKQMVRANRLVGLQSEVYFYYEGMKKYPDVYKELYKERVEFPNFLRR